jgi:hypothetical protein
MSGIGQDRPAIGHGWLPAPGLPSPHSRFRHGGHSSTCVPPSTGTSMSKLPTSTRALVLRKRDPVDGKVYHAAEIAERTLPALGPGQLLVRVAAVGFNRRDVRFTLGFDQSKRLTHGRFRSTGRGRACTQDYSMTK